MDKTEAVPVARLKMRSIPTLPASIALYDLLRLFQVSSLPCDGRPLDNVISVRGPCAQYWIVSNSV